MTVYSLKTLVSGLSVDVNGDLDCSITGVATIQDAIVGQLTFLNNPHYRKYLAQTQASVVVLSPDDAADCPVTCVISRNPYFTYAKMASYFLPTAQSASGIHETAVIGEDCQIDASATIHAGTVIGNQVQIGKDVVIGAGTVIGDHVTIGAHTQLDARVTLYHHVQLGKRVRLASGVVIGADGFGFANDQGRWHKVPQLGRVVIGDDVDIGANTTIDRGAIDDTVIANGVKLDNLIQVGHNVRIGENTIIAGCVAIAGSATIGKNCMIGGKTAIAGHVNVTDHVIMTGMTTVTKSITEPGLYSSGIVGAIPNAEFRKNNARFNRLEQLQKRVKQCETTLKKINERSNA